MGAFASLLAGFGQGAGEHNANIIEQKRQEKVARQKAVSDALLKSVENDPNLSWEERQRRTGMVLENYGLKQPDIQGLLGHFDAIVGSPDKPAGAQPKPQAMAGPVPQGPQSSTQAPPTQQSGLGPMPQAPPATAYGLPAIAGKSYTPMFPQIYDQNGMMTNMTQIPQVMLNQEMENRANWRKNADTALQQEAQESSRYNRESKLAQEEHNRAMTDMQAAGAKGQHMTISMINGHERAVPDKGSFEGLVYGGNIQDQDVPDKSMIYRRRRYSDGTFDYVPTTKAVESITNDSSSPTGAWKTVYDQAGNFITRVPVNPQAALLPHTRESVQEVTDNSGHIVKETVPLQSGVTIPKSATPTSPVPTRGGKNLGIAPSETKAQWDNPLTAAAQTDAKNTSAALDLVDRVEKSIKDYVAKNPGSKNTPTSTFLPSLAYSLGFGTDTSAMLSQLNIGRIVEAGRLVHPTGSRNLQVLEQAQIHTPDAWKDSPQLMIDKLESIKNNLGDYLKENETYGKKRPGMPAPRNTKSATPTTPMPSNNPSLDELIRRHGGQ